ncbi:MAG TPA: CTB family bacteriocin [Leptolyngbya sp.]|jgi:hypothetical protein|nr:CTB family bacteriocin [Leptolyngbya sp.]
MIITELSYQEITSDAIDLEGGTDLSVNFTQFQQAMNVMQTGSSSGPAGSTSFTNAQSLKINTGSFNAIVLGA